MKKIIAIIVFCLFMGYGSGSYIGTILKECATQTQQYTGHSIKKCAIDSCAIAMAESSFFKNASNNNAFGLMKKGKKIVYGSYEENIVDFVRRWNIYRYDIEGKQWITKANFNSGEDYWFNNFNKGLKVCEQKVSNKLKYPFILFM